MATESARDAPGDPSTEESRETVWNVKVGCGVVRCAGDVAPGAPGRRVGVGTSNDESTLCVRGTSREDSSPSVRDISALVALPVTLAVLAKLMPSVETALEDPDDCSTREEAIDCTVRDGVTTLLVSPVEGIVDSIETSGRVLESVREFGTGVGSRPNREDLD